MRSTVLAVVLAVVVSSSGSGCQHHQAGSTPTPRPALSGTPEAKPPLVTHAQATRQTVTTTLPLLGTVVADKSLQVPSRATGQIVDLLVVEGDRVARGQTLATVDTAESRLAVKQAQADLSEQLAGLGLRSTRDKLRDRTAVPSVVKAKAVLDNAEETYRRYEGLHREQLVSDIDLSNQRAAYLAARADHQAALEMVDQSLAGVEAARLAVEVAEQKVTEATISAPLDGVVDSVSTAPGAFVSAGGDSGIVLLKVRPLYLSLEVPQEHLSQFQVGRPVTFETAAYPGRKVTAVVSDLAGSVNARSGAATGRARIADPPAWLEPGMVAQVQLSTGQQPDRLLVPQAAVLTQAGRSVVFVATKATTATATKGTTATAHSRPVELGQVLGDWVEVGKGDLTVQDLLITSELLALKDGDKVEIGAPLTISPPVTDAP